MKNHLALAFFALAVSLSACGSNPTELVTHPDTGGGGAGGGTAGGTGSGGTPGAGGGSFLPPPDASAGAPPVCVGDACAPSDPDASVFSGCGNKVLDPSESCDDGNSVPGDGCSGICQVEPNYACPTVGQPCVSTVVCGDSTITGNEACDDGNKTAGDGCSADCKAVETGWACGTAGQPCTQVQSATCGDGAVNAGETCDDKNRVDGDGCSANCQREAGWSCPTPGSPCVRDEFCGDGKLNGSELCDDGNNNPGDGCTGACTLEPFFTCPTAGQPCVSLIVCGDSKITGDEACDDGNKTAGDGCSADCKKVESGYRCPTAGGVGGACTALPADACGDGRLTYGEFCDDGNLTDGDGCDHTCHVEAGYTCATPGVKCTLLGFCGDGTVNPVSEQCDDGNTTNGDGCSSCTIDTSWYCSGLAPSVCVHEICGNGVRTPSEACDDGNLVVGDGCNASCTVEDGWACPTVNKPCIPKCGDAKRKGPETCDDGNTINGDGCNANCRAEFGYVCTGTGAGSCVKAVCPNGIKEAGEGCDDGNSIAGDGCGPTCQSEPTVTVGPNPVVNTFCGDGLKTGTEACDDGDNTNGDGCSSTCTIETGFTCTQTLNLPPSVEMRVAIRDFKSGNATSGGGHPDFNYNNWGNHVAGLAGDLCMSTNATVCGRLDAQGKPWLANTTGAIRTDSHIKNASTFALWYRDSNTTPVMDEAGANPIAIWPSSPFLKTVKLLQQAPGSPTYKFASGAFFPLGPTEGFGQIGPESPHCNNDTGIYCLAPTAPGWCDPNCGATCYTQNYGFTTELRYFFQYQGGEVLDFTGDDDVWVFVNGKLAVDLGGLHGSMDGSVTLDASGTDTRFGITQGNVYEIVLFHAERHVVASNFNLTLTGFLPPRSNCSPICGDGIVAGGEACDDGPYAGATGNWTDNTTVPTGRCNHSCTARAYCGDGVVQTGEACDNGTNIDLYVTGSTVGKCGPGCTTPATCGDGTTQVPYEQCDFGAGNSNSAYGPATCTTTCHYGPHCGDAVITNSEVCDDGVNNGTSVSSCGTDCLPKCGNGVLDPKEQCDNGRANNVGGYAACNPDCTLGPRCGDGIKNGPELCDDGKNDGTYGMCAPGCVFGPRCGDAVVQAAAGEVCDLGAANLPVATAYGNGKCTIRCKPAPYCGDKEVDAAFGEKCDDGKNDGTPGSCLPDCSGYVPLLSCGDGIVQAPKEQCDDGTAKNGTAASTCDAHCKWKCGNGVKDPGEDCDDGVNNGTYGTCTAQCKLAGYCGDSIKNGPEQCDLGPANEANPYGAGKCTTACLNAPFCGDGRIQSAFGELCDGGYGCNPTTCLFTIIN